MPTTTHCTNQRLLFACSLICLCVMFGCSNTPVAQEQNSPATEQSRSTSKMSIDEVLARTDYSEAARDKFEKWKRDGRTEVTQEEFDKAIRTSLIRMPVMMEITSKFSRPNIPQPSLATLKAQLPFEYPDGPINALEFKKQKREYYRIGVEHFLNKKNHLLGDEDRKEVAKFMNAVFFGPEDEFHHEQWQGILDDGRALFRRLSRQLQREPMFHMCMAIAELRTNYITEARRRLDQVILDFTKDDYPTRMPIVALRIRNNVRKKNRSSTGNDLRVAAMKHWITKDFRARGVDERYAMAEVESFLKIALGNEDWPALEDFFNTLESSETLPPWFRAMAMAKYHFNVGYFHRGNDTAGKVSKKGWKLLKKHSEEAHKFYEEALRINPKFPEAATGLMDIARLGYSDHDEDYWFKKAIEHEFDYMTAYNARLFGLMPRWGGSVEEMIEFAKEEAGKGNYESGVPFIMPSCLFFIRDKKCVDESEYQELICNPDTQSEIIKALKGLIEHNEQLVFNGRHRDKKYLKTLLALFLVAANQNDEAERIYKSLDGIHSIAATNHFGVGASGSLDAIQAQASARNAEYGIEAKELEKLFKGDLESRLKNHDAIVELVDNISLSDESGGLFFQRAREQVTLEKAFRDGKLIELKFDRALNMWQNNDNRVLKYVSESAATFSNDTGTSFNRIFHHAWFPGPRMTEATFTFPSKLAPQKDFAPGFMTGADGNKVFSVGATLVKDRSSNLTGQPGKRTIQVAEVCFGNNTNNGSTQRYRFACRGNQCTLRTFVDEHYIEIYVDDQFLLRQRAKFLLAPAIGFAIQCQEGLGGKGKVEISDIKLQKWIGQPPKSNQRKDFLAHYRKAFESNPDDKWNAFWFAQAMHVNGDLEGALPLYKQACNAGVNKGLAGFYIGDILDRQGKHKQAFEWYVESAIGLSEGGPANRLSASQKIYSRGNPVNWSCFRANWLMMVHGYQLNEVPKDGISSITNGSKRAGFKWLDKCASIIKDGNSGHSKNQSIKLLTELRENSTPRHKPLIDEILAAFETKGGYLIGSGQEPLYLKVSGITPFFYGLGGSELYSRP